MTTGISFTRSPVFCRLKIISMAPIQLLDSVRIVEITTKGRSKIVFEVFPSCSSNQI